jgi:hypothetical protein
MAVSYWADLSELRDELIVQLATDPQTPSSPLKDAMMDNQWSLLARVQSCIIATREAIADAQRKAQRDPAGAAHGMKPSTTASTKATVRQRRKGGELAMASKSPQMVERSRLDFGRWPLGPLAS